MKKIKYLLILICIFSFNNIIVFANNIFQDCPVSDEYKKWLKLPDDERTEYNMPKYCASKDEIENKKPFNVLPDNSVSSFKVDAESAVLPEKYDLRNVNGNNYVTSVKNQEQTGTCWAHASMASIESNILKNGGESLDLSEAHIAYSISQNYFNDGTNANGFNKKIAGDGANRYYSSAYFTRLDGPVLESNFKFADYYDITNNMSKNDHMKSINLIELKKPVKLDVNEINMYNYSSCDSESLNKIKTTIMEKGALTADYYSSNNYSNGMYLFHNGEETINHAITIIGWDDTISKTNFKEGVQPINDGAFIVKNSWGTGESCYYLEDLIQSSNETIITWDSNDYNNASEVPRDYTLKILRGNGYTIDETKKTACKTKDNNGGIYYISYEDTNICKEISSYSDIDFEIEDNVYYYDTLGYIGNIGSGSNIAYATNKYNLKSNKEILKEVTIGLNKNTNYDVFLSYDKDSNEKIFLGSGTTESDGYKTIKINNPIILKNDFYIIVKYTSTNNYIYPVAVSVSEASGYENISLDVNEAFFSSTGEPNTWYDLSNDETVRIPSIKAYTNNFDYDVILNDVIVNDNTIDKYKIPVTMSKLDDTYTFDNNKFSVKVLDSNQNDVTSNFDITNNVIDNSNTILDNGYLEVEKKNNDVPNGTYNVEVTYEYIIANTEIVINNSNPTIMIGDVSYTPTTVYNNDNNKLYDISGGTVNIPVSASLLESNSLNVEIKNSNNDIMTFQVNNATLQNGSTILGVVIPPNAVHGTYTIKVSNGLIYDESSFAIQQFINVQSINALYNNIEIDDITLVLNDTLQIETNILPATSTLKTIDFTSEDEDIVSVNSTGLITANTVGETTVSLKVGTFTKLLNIIVINPSISIGTVSLESNIEGNSTIDNNYGGNFNNTLTFNNYQLNKNNISYKIFNSNEEEINYFTINDIVENNKLKLSIIYSKNNISLPSGIYNVYYYYNLGDTKQTILSDNFEIELKNYVPVTNVNLNVNENNKVIINKNDTYQLLTKSVNILPANSTNNKYRYESTNTTVATVNEAGLITAIKGGETNINIISLDNSNIYATLKVIVDQPYINLSNVQYNPAIQINSENKIYNTTNGIVNIDVVGYKLNSNDLGVTIKNQNNVQINFDVSNKVLTNNNTSLKINIPQNTPSGKYTVVVSNGDVNSSTEFEIFEYVSSSDVKLFYGQTELNNIILKKSDILNVSSTVLPEKSTLKKVNYSIEDTTIASIDTEDNITTKKLGNTKLIIKIDSVEKKIPLYVVDNSFTKSIVINSNIENNTIDTKYGGIFKFKYTIPQLPNNIIINTTIDDYTNNKNMFLKNYNGSLTNNELNFEIEYKGNNTLEEGIYNITSYFETTKKEKLYLNNTFNISKCINVTEITTTETTKIKIDKNKTYDLKSLNINVLPVNATNKKYNYISSNNNVLTVNSNGIVTGKSGGSANVEIVSIDNNNIKKIVQFEINDPTHLEFDNTIKEYNNNNIKYLKGLEYSNKEINLNNILSKINTNQEIKAYKSDKLLSSSDIISTGTIIKIGDVDYNVVVQGDVNGDGKVSITDLSQIRKHLAKINGYEKKGSYLEAIDMNYDNKASIIDLSKMRKKLAGVK